jgi:hypothetical protein
MEATCSPETSVDFQRTTLRYIPEVIVTVCPEKQPLLDNGCVTRNTGVTVGRHVFYVVRAEVI